MKKAIKIHYDGIVQGVGFRPFVFKIANNFDINGWVKNSSNGLDIHAEGEKIEEFTFALQNETPPLATITATDISVTEYQGYTDFKIIKSDNAAQADVLISPDIRTCPDCLQEMFDKGDRRYLYPFINCTNCGPRYTIIRDRPYDRDKTTMDTFSMCSRCREEYEDPLDRRFHAQPVACEVCGPSLRLLDGDGREIEVLQSVKLLESGAIIAVKGLGGFHLVCDAYNEPSVKKLRDIKERGLKPFALMVRNLDIASQEVYLSEEEKNILTSPASPIVLLSRLDKYDSKLSSHVAPNLHTLGIMLPYTPIHHLLFQSTIDVLVMTSANLSGQPLIYDNEIALRDLNGIADYFLVHDRDIFHPCDDSVIQVIGGKTTFLRRARGYVPLPIFLQSEVHGSIAALGGELKNAFCLASGEKAFMSQYIGDMHGYDNYERFELEFHSYQKVANVFPDKVSYDLHPEYATSKMAKQMKLPKCTVQHHHAHLVSVMEEYRLNKPTLGIICDGTGYGEDGRIWGFEFLYGDATSYERKAHLEYLPLPGGDAGAKKPLRIAYAYLQQLLSPSEYQDTELLWANLSALEKTILDGQLKSGFQIYETSSAGRLFDVVSALLGVCLEVSYEGQAAIELESEAISWLTKINKHHSAQDYATIFGLDYAPEVRKMKQEASDRLECLRQLIGRSQDSQTSFNTLKSSIEDIYTKMFETRKENDLYSFDFDMDLEAVVLKPGSLFRTIVSEILVGKPRDEIAFRYHYSLACIMLETVLIIEPKKKEVVLSGGVFQNKLLTEILLDLAKEIGVITHYPSLLPAGDGGLALGQVLIANSYFKQI
ncbi:MAG: hydrogenase maturation protein HypF [Gracilibacter sp. BRH_c7a]|nr:MAG: hydrogenase maturation protein HypF [Gracilibacter sp. BRH_c7a]